MPEKSGKGPATLTSAPRRVKRRVGGRPYYRSGDRSYRRQRRRCRSAGLRARGQRREAGQHHAQPRLRRHDLRGHGAQRDRARPRVGARRRARRGRHGPGGRAGVARARRRRTRTSGSRCCSRRWRRAALARRTAAGAARRRRLRALDVGDAARRVRGDPARRRRRPGRARRARRALRADGGPARGHGERRRARQHRLGVRQRLRADLRDRRCRRSSPRWATGSPSARRSSSCTCGCSPPRRTR